MNVARKRLVTACLALSGAGAVPVAGAAQVMEEASLRVTVRTSAADAPVRSAQVMLLGTGYGGLTGEDGSILFERLPAGPMRVQVRYIGYAAETAVVALSADRTSELGVWLSEQPIRLAPVEAVVRARRGPELLEANGFYRRRTTGIGVFFTREEIKSRHAMRLSEVLRSVPGVRLSASGSARQHASCARARSSPACPIQYFVDGVPVHAFNIDEVAAADVEGLEVYRGTSQVPIEFNRATAMCGVVVIWTRVD